MIIHTALYKKLTPKLPVTIPTQSGSLTYTGGQQSPSWSDFYDNLMTISGKLTGTNAGTYTVTFRLKDKEQYQWANGTVTDKTVQWRIKRALIPVPSQIDAPMYTGNLLSPTWANYDPDKMDIIPLISGEGPSVTSAINSGLYEVSFRVKDNYYFIDNYNPDYEPDLIGTTGVTVYWSIIKASQNVTVNPTSITLDSSNTSKTITVNRSGDGAISATSSNTSIATVSVSGNIVTVSSVNNTNGTAEITISVASSTNYEAGSTTVSCQTTFSPTWQTGELPIYANWTDIIYGNNKFVAVSNNGGAIYSEDGTNWNVSNLSSKYNWGTVTYGNNKFVVSSASRMIGYSVDGTNWTDSVLSDYSNRVKYFKDKFISFGGSASTNKYSEDGINWAKISSLNNMVHDIAYGNNKFVAVCYGESFYYSEDGITWHVSESLKNESWEKVIFGNGIFVAIPQEGKTSAYSTDGINWTSSTCPSLEYLGDISFGNGKFILTGWDSNILYESEDGINWVEVFVNESAKWNCSAYGNNKFVILPYSGDNFLYL